MKDQDPESIKLDVDPTDRDRRQGDRTAQTEQYAGRIENVYASRRTKVRLLILVFLLMFVLLLMFEAGKPENWRWMGFEKNEPPIDTRLLANLKDSSNLTKSSEEPKTDNSGTNSRSNGTLDEQAKEAAELKAAEKEFWDSAYRRLNYRQRVLLLQGLYLARHGKSLSQEQATEWLGMVEEFTNANERYQTDILQFMTTLGESDPQRGVLSRIVFTLRNRWEKFQTVLESIGDPEHKELPDAGALAELQAVLDQTLLDHVRDNSLQSVVDDQPALFRLLERIQDEKPGTVSLLGESIPVEEVQFAQLYKETERLRGKTVRFTGVIRGGYVSRPAPNYLNVNRFYVFWIQIKGAQNPVAVYALQPPNDFVVNLEKYTLNNPAELNEPVRVTGLLFQKMVYASNDGQRIAPVVLTDVVEWVPRESGEGRAPELPGMTVLFASMLGAGALFLVTTIVLINLNQRKHRQRLAEIKSRFAEADDQQENA